MIRNYFKLALKSIISQGHQSIINAIGMAVALSCSILILLYVQYEISYDRYHKNADHIYRIIVKQPADLSYMGNDVFAITPAGLKYALVNDIPEVKNSTKCKLNSHTLEYNSNLFTENGFLYADQDFLKIFTFPVISGNPAEALKEPFALFITREMATKYFGNEDPVGKTIKADNKYVFTVRGVLENIPDNSHFDFDFLTGFETLYSIRGGKEKVENWRSFSYTTYLQLSYNVRPQDIDNKLKELGLRYLSKTLFKDIQWILQPLKDIHLSGNANFEIGRNSDVKYLYLITSIGIFILLIACFNYMNMATARSYNRGREIGILKVAGSSKADLIVQFITESVLLSFAGLILATGMVWFILPVFSNFTDRLLSFWMIFEYSTLSKVILLTLSAGLFAGIYPAFHLSSLSPLRLIKEGFKNIDGKRRSVNLRNLLVVLQYVISIVALICTFTLLRQLNFIKNTDLGFVKDNILTISLNDPAIRKSPDVLISELRRNSEIEDITNSSDLPYSITSASFAEWEGRPAESQMTVFEAGIGNNFIDFYKLNIASGRKFSTDFYSDTAKSLIINQTTAKTIGWTDPVDKKFGFDPKDLETVVGVVKDFNFQSLHQPVQPLVLFKIGNKEYPEPRFISVKVNSGRISETRSFVEKKLKELSPHYLNPVSVLSDRIEAIYSSERKLASILIFSTILAVILTCLGQYSLSSYTTKSRMKEMVIRKVMGSQPSEIMAMFTSEMAKWILVSIVFAWPVAYLVMTKWLQGFAYHIKIGTGVFIYSLLITLLISLVAISYHVIMLSKVNPAEMIRQE